MKPDYYTHQHTREVVETTKDGDDYKHKRVMRTEGEHVMTYKVWKTMKVRDVAQIIGVIVEPMKAKTTGKKARKAAKAAEETT